MASMARGSNDLTILRVAQREIPLVVSRNSRARRITLRLDGLSGDVRLVLPKRMALRADGHLGGYRWGLERKAALLRREAEIVPE